MIVGGAPRCSARVAPRPAVLIVLIVVVVVVVVLTLPKAPVPAPATLMVPKGFTALVHWYMGEMRKILDAANEPVVNSSTKGIPRPVRALNAGVECV